MLLSDFTPDVTVWAPVWELMVPGHIAHPGLLLLLGQEEVPNNQMMEGLSQHRLCIVPWNGTCGTTLLQNPTLTRHSDSVCYQ